MNVSEALQDALVKAIRAATHKCFACNGRKTMPDHSSPRDEVVLDDGRIAMAYASVPCDGCDGNGIVVASPAHPFVTSMVMSAVVGEMFRAREENNTHSLNEALDWGMRFSLGSAQASGISLADAVEQFEQLLEESPLNEILAQPETLAPAGGLSQEDLRELGVLEGDG